MASKSVNVKLLAAIASGAVDRISQADALPLMPPATDPGLIFVDTADIVDSKAKVSLSEAGKALLAEMSTKAQTANSASATAVHQNFAIISGAQLPASKRRGGGAGAPTKYPFDQLGLGDSFFVPNSASKDGNAVKHISSSVSTMNIKYSEETGETKQVERTKRGPKNKAVLDAAGNKVKETATVKVRKPVRKFSVRPVEAGKTYGTYVAPEDGALVARVL